jgi:hypothetical protein
MCLGIQESGTNHVNTTDRTLVDKLLPMQKIKYTGPFDDIGSYHADIHIISPEVMHYLFDGLYTFISIENFREKSIQSLKNIIVMIFCMSSCG